MEFVACMEAGVAALKLIGCALCRWYNIDVITV